MNLYKNVATMITPAIKNEASCLRHSGYCHCCAAAAAAVVAPLTAAFLFHNSRGAFLISAEGTISRFFPFYYNVVGKGVKSAPGKITKFDPLVRQVKYFTSISVFLQIHVEKCSSSQPTKHFIFNLKHVVTRFRRHLISTS